MGLGEVYEDKGLYKEAIEEYKKVIELDGKHTGAMYNLALVYEKVDPKEAIAQWERYIALASQLPSEKDWVDVARQHLRKLKSQVKDVDAGPVDELRKDPTRGQWVLIRPKGEAPAERTVPLLSGRGALAGPRSPPTARKARPPTAPAGRCGSCPSPTPISASSGSWCARAWGCST